MVNIQRKECNNGMEISKFQNECYDIKKNNIGNRNKRYVYLKKEKGEKEYIK
ncbi:hypothetical protein PIROE2DRAFT_19382 [Piromyces sp. E2]|nr:hypothetical protein PIROE2DRAFT_19382 [Piromyces sp. E2]|eukprot:OUM56150.1 hypothetical protein PIROE2DRAFT_19382 [Piromyces sp. E2]